MKFLLGIDHYMSMYRQDPIVHRDLKPENVLASRMVLLLRLLILTGYIFMHQM